jgi:AcrR family transcriptional regulator
MVASGKLTGDERRASIIQAVRHLFANKGFKGARTREMAEAAGVSEALLYRHFPTKDALFAAIKQSFCDDRARARFDRLGELAPSTKTLVLHVHFLAAKIMGGPEDRDEKAIQSRMILRSLAEDGEFARLLLEPLATIFVPKIEECLKAAVAAGDALSGPLQKDLGGWLVYHLAAMSAFFSAPARPINDFDGADPKVIRQVVWFALRGLGLNEAAIQKYYAPEQFSGMEV